VIDTSALLAALIAEHEHHDLARPHLGRRAAVPAIVLAETFAQLRRTFRQPAEVATAVLRPWIDDPGRILGTPADAVATVLRRAVELDLGGNVHDALIAQVCAHHGSPLITLDRRQHAVALALGADSTYLLA
jgi:predicted nucleic acid-binding protein